MLRGARTRGSRQVTIGVADAVPKLITWRVLEPLLAGNGKFYIICHETPLNALLADLAAHRLDLVLATSGVPTDSSFKAYSHLLGKSEIGSFSAKPLVERLRRDFPQSLHDAPLLVPTDRSANRRVLDLWFEKQGITPRIVDELDDSALVKNFSQYGVGAFAIPLAIENEVTRQYKVTRVGCIEGLKARFYAISTERRIKHPALAMITETARTGLFSQFPNGNTRAEAAA